MASRRRTKPKQPPAPKPPEMHPTVAVDYRFESFRLMADGKRFGPDAVELNRSVTAAELELTMQGGSTLTVTVEDPDGELLRSSTLTRWAWGENSLDEKEWLVKGRPIDAELDDLFFRLVKISKQGTSLTLVFEDRAVVWLKQRIGARKAKRGKVTRAQFVQMLVDELAKNGRVIPTVIPELKEKQPIARPDVPESDRRDSVASPGINASKGGRINRGAKLTVKGAKATPAQIAAAERMLNIAVKLKSPTKAMVALIAGGIVESALGAVYHEVGGGGGIGILQSTGHGFESFDRQVTRFLVGPAFRGLPSLTAHRLVKEHPELTPGQIAGRVLGPASQYLHRYDQYRHEAEAFVRAFAGGNLSSLSGGMDGERTESFSVMKPYNFERGKNESSWDAIRRLAEEVQWRAFVRRGRLYYVSENRLFAQKPELVIAEGRDGVDTIDCDVDIGVRTKRLGATTTVMARADRWTALPGMVVEVEDAGPVEGRWLVSSVRRPSLFDAAVEIELAKPVPKRAEPAPEVETRTRTISVPGGGEFGVRKPDGSPSREWGNPLRTMSPITGVFGENRGDHAHAGLDIAQPTGTPVFAARDGVVETAGTLGGYGNCIIINHGGPNRTSTLYGHLSSIRARVGQRVKRGQWIGNVGSTGNSTGPHLHFEVRFGGRAVDPRPYLPGA